MNISNSFEEIMNYSHFWNWTPDWQVVKDIYEEFPNSYAVLSPFAYSYLEEIEGYFSLSQSTDEGDNRNSVAYGYMHPRFWNKAGYNK